MTSRVWAHTRGWLMLAVVVTVLHHAGFNPFDAAQHIGRYLVLICWGIAVIPAGLALFAFCLLSVPPKR